MNNYQKLKWDSELFGYGIAKITSNNLTGDNLNKILKNLAGENIRLVYWSIDPKDRTSNNTALANNGTLVDTKITYIKNITETLFEKPEFIYSVINHPIPTKIISLALQSGLYSRFKNDSHFKNNEFEKLYKAWIESSLNGKIAKDVLVYKEFDDELGLITIGVKNNRCNIGLLAVDEKMRGKSIGTLLINAAFEKCKKLGYNDIQVVTQKTNVGACTFYEKMGFEKEKEENIYHFWL